MASAKYPCAAEGCTVILTGKDALKRHMAKDHTESSKNAKKGSSNGPASRFAGTWRGLFATDMSTATERSLPCSLMIDPSTSLSEFTGRWAVEGLGSARVEGWASENNLVWRTVERIEGTVMLPTTYRGKVTRSDKALFGEWRIRDPNYDEEHDQSGPFLLKPEQAFPSAPRSTRGEQELNLQVGTKLGSLGFTVVSFEAAEHHIYALRDRLDLQS